MWNEWTIGRTSNRINHRRSSNWIVLDSLMWNEWTKRGNTFNYPHKLKELTHIFSLFSHFVARLAQPGPMTFSKKNLNACPQFLVVPHRCCINVFFHHSGVEVQPARTKFREAYCLVRSTINRSAINRWIVEYHSVSKYSQHWSSCWAQCVFLVKLTCQLYLQVHYCLVWSAINRSAINRRIVEYHSE